MISTLPWNNDLTHLQQAFNTLLNLALQFTIPRGTQPHRRLSSLYARDPPLEARHRSCYTIVPSRSSYEVARW